MVFATQPAGALAATAFTTQPIVKIEDVSGNVITTYNGPVTLSIGTNPSAGTLSCATNPRFNAVSGVATFAGCKIDNAGTGYSLHAVAGTLTAADSSAFNVSSATALSPTSGAKGTTGVTISAAGFIASHALTVTVRWSGRNDHVGWHDELQWQLDGDLHDPDGAATGSDAVVVSDGTNSATSGTNFTVTTATATGLSPTTGTVGSSATIDAANFINSHALTVTVGGNAATITSAATGGTGSSTVTFTIPAVANGARAVVVSVRDELGDVGSKLHSHSVGDGSCADNGCGGDDWGDDKRIHGFIASHALTIKVGGVTAAKPRRRQRRRRRRARAPTTN